MKRTTHDMQVNVAGLRRNLKNLAHNYSDAQRKVREATSNDPWGPSSTLMAEIADLTYNVVAFTEIMQMIWKRLNDHGRNWRHVYKALVLLEYLIKTGSEKVGQQCKENIFAIKTLKDFQYMEEGRDQGQNVREKAKQLVILLKDDERLRSERARALKAKERFAQSASGFGSDRGLDTPTSPKYPAFSGEDWMETVPSRELPRELENARPQTVGEEELQLQLALAMSREEAEQEEQKRRSDDVRLQLALSQSQQDFKQNQDKPSHVLDLLDVNLGADMQKPPVDPWGMPQPPKAPSSPWQSTSLPSPPNKGPSSVDPWAPVAASGYTKTSGDPWNPQTSPQPLPETAIRSNPWSPASQSSSTDLDEFDVITNRNKSSPKSNGALSNNNNNTSDPFELNLMVDALPLTGPSPSTGATKKTPQSFLGENSSLVNLDNLVTSKPANSVTTANPFSDGQPPRAAMFNTAPPKPSINQIKQTPFMSSAEFSSSPTPLASGPAFGSNPSFGTSTQFGPGFGSNGSFGPSLVQDPWAPVAPPATQSSPWTKNGEQPNPFLS